MASAPEEGRRSTLAILREVLVSLTRMVEDSTELLAASIREELQRFRSDLARHALSLAAVLAGGALLTAGLAIFVRQMLGSWAWTLTLFGIAYLGLGLALQRVPSASSARSESGGNEAPK